MINNLSNTWVPLTGIKYKRDERDIETDTYTETNVEKEKEKQEEEGQEEEGQEEEEEEEDRKEGHHLHHIHRFKFTGDCMIELHNFSKIHQYDERKDFKDAWKQWIEDYQDIIDDETKRLRELGYEGDIVDKMYKSARYYFRKKSSVKQAPCKRRQYINVTRELLDLMDDHIKLHMANKNYKPKTGFVEFCNINATVIKEIINSIMEQGVSDYAIIEDKIKKTYKNRYFTLTQG